MPVVKVETLNGFTVNKLTDRRGNVLDYQIVPVGYDGRDPDCIMFRPNLTAARVAAGFVPKVVPVNTKRMRDYPQNTKGYRADSERR